MAAVSAAPHASAIAVVGMAVRLPGAPDLATYFQNLSVGFDAIVEAPADRLDPVFYDPSSTAPDRLYCKRGGFLSGPVLFDAAAFGVMPVAAEGAEPDQLLALELASNALADAGYHDRSFDRARATVVLGRGGYLTPGVARLDMRVRGAEVLARSLRALVPGITEAQIDAVKAEMQADLGPYGKDTAIGLVPNLAASRIANRLDLRGGAYTVDAACASSLVAIDHACRDLSANVADLAIAGGAHLCHDPSFYSVFCQLGALSRTESIRPFDARADGLLIGEGIGMVVLKRLRDAERDGDRIYAVVRGSGVSSDGRSASLMTPAIEGQVLALMRAWQRAGIDPATVGLVEAHGTGTPAGDAAELATLARVFGPADGASRRAVLGSVKSMIGHTMPAAGVAGFVKAVLAVHHGVLLPTLHCEEPRAELAATRFRTIDRAEPWERSEHPRRAGVNAFGFGGVNAHVVIEEHAPRSTSASASASNATNRAAATAANPGASATNSASAANPAAAPTIADPAEPMLLFAAESPQALIEALRDAERALASGAPLPSPTNEGDCRVALINPTPERIARAQQVIRRGDAWRARDDIFFTARPLAAQGGKVAFVFPGVDASFVPRVDDVAERFGLPCAVPKDTSQLKDLGLGIIAVNRLLDAALREIGVAPELIAGHSIGEWSGMIASEMIPREDVDRIIAALAPEDVEVPGVAFVAAGCSVAKAERAIHDLSHIAVSHDNCPHQVLICGRDESVDVALDRLKKEGILCQKLPFRSGYHSPLFADFVGPHQRVLRTLPLTTPSVPLWSATTCAPYPSDPDDVRALAVDHVVQPVRFRELTNALFEHGVRIFVQVGTGSLVGFIGDTLRGRPHLAISANVAGKSGLAQLRRLACALWVEGVPVSLDRLFLKAISRPVAPPPKPAARPVELSLGVPIYSPPPLPPRTDPPPSLRFEDISSDSDPLVAEMAASARELRAATDEVWKAFEASRAPAVPVQREVTIRREMSVDRYPYLVDHSFYRQRAGWPSMEDRYPVVPMTMLIATMMEIARELCPSRIPIGLSRVRALRWLAVAPPVELTIHAKVDGDTQVEITIEGYASGVVEMASVYPAAPRADVAPLANAAPARITAAALYDDRWMFHGPAYQGVVDLGTLGKDGIRGTLVSLEAKGGLLDNAGQLLGYWVMENAAVDRLAMPVILEKVRFFGHEPTPGERLECTVRIRDFDATLVRADVELSRAGRAWCRIEGWEDRRFDTDPRVWNILMFPEKNLVTEMRPERFGVLRQPWRGAASRDLLARRYLTERERRDQHKVGPRGKGEWLLARMAIKDVVRQHLWDRGHGPLFPAEIEIESEPSGRPVVRGPACDGLHVSAAHKQGLVVAKIAEGRACGVDLERIEPRSADFEELAFTPSERALLPPVEGPRSSGRGGESVAEEKPASTSRDVAITRFWVAKEAAAKARGTGLAGNPSRFVVREVMGDRLLVGAEGQSTWVETMHLDADHIVGWTCP
ncbi:MAG: beta-ketoacyl synthase N-terminal-like domain-containing protein [Polyangiaceae bacterium]